MIFTNLVSMANYIKRIHCSFADGFISDTLNVLGNLNKAIMESTNGLCGATFNAITDSSHGELTTEIEINKIKTGGWNLNERVIGE